MGAGGAGPPGRTNASGGPAQLGAVAPSSDVIGRSSTLPKAPRRAAHGKCLRDRPVLRHDRERAVSTRARTRSRPFSNLDALARHENLQTETDCTSASRFHANLDSAWHWLTAK